MAGLDHGACCLRRGAEHDFGSLCATDRVSELHLYRVKTVPPPPHVIAAVNRGRRAITIEDLGLEYLGGRRHRAVIYWPAGGMPRALDESGLVKGFIPCDAVDLKNVSRAFAQVSDGRLYRSRKYKHAERS